MAAPVVVAKAAMIVASLLITEEGRGAIKKVVIVLLSLIIAVLVILFTFLQGGSKHNPNNVACRAVHPCAAPHAITVSHPMSRQAKTRSPGHFAGNLARPLVTRQKRPRRIFARFGKWTRRSKMQQDTGGWLKGATRRVTKSRAAGLCELSGRVHLFAGFSCARWL